MDWSPVSYILAVSRVFPGTIGGTVKLNKLALAAAALVIASTQAHAAVINVGGNAQASGPLS
jgi:hypothetical protein